MDIQFAGQIFAPHYATGVPRIATSSQPLRSGSAADAPVLSEAVIGDEIEIFEIAQHRAWGRSGADGAVGYLDGALLSRDVTPATHFVAAVTTPLLAAPEKGASILDQLPMGARIGATETVGPFLSTAHGYVAVSDAIPIGQREHDPVDWAEKLVGVEWREGGRSGFGVNCTGLVFLAFQMAGIRVPRFCDLQAKTIGTALLDAGDLVRGDLVYFQDHVAIMKDSTTAIHSASGHGVVEEPLSAIVEANQFGAPTTYRRVK